MRKVVALILTVVAVLVAAPAHSNVSGKWNKDTISVYIASPMAPGWRIDEVIAAWNAGPYKLVRVYEPCIKCITVRVQYPINVDWAGLAWVWKYEDGTIDDCQIDVDGNRNYYKSRTNIISHEIGHCLGLEHNHLRWSVMSSSSKIHAYKRPLPFPKDISNLWAGYL